MDDLIDCKKQSHDTNTANRFKSGEGYSLNNRRSHTGDAMQSFDVFGKHLTTSDLFQNCDGKDTCDKPYTYDICGKGLGHNSNLQNKF
jgi:hypothetical protein